MPDKLGGVILMVASIAILFLLPWLDTSRVRSAKFRPIFKQLFWIFVIDCIVLGIAGAKPAEGLWLIIGRLATVYYFLHFLVLLPFVGWFERPKPLPESIHQPVLAASAGAAAVPPEVQR